MAHDGADLGELPDGVPDLLVQDFPIRDDDHRVEERLALPFQPDQLVGKPGDGVGLAAACRVLNQIPGADSPTGRIGQEPAHHVQLVVAGPYLLAPLAPRFLVLRHHDLGVVLDDVNEPFAGENLVPQVVGLEAVGVRRMARAVVPPPVEGQEPGRLAFEMGAELHLVVVHGEMSQAAAKLEELLAGMSVALVLLDGVIYRLLGQVVLQLEGGDGQAIDEQAQIQGKLGLIPAVAELPRHAEAVLSVLDLGLLVPRRRCAIKEVDMVRPVIYALAQHVDGSALADFPLQPGQELAPGRAVLAQIQRYGNVGLGGMQECGKLGQVHAVLPVVVLGVSAYPAGAVAGRPLAHCAPMRRIAGGSRQHRADEALEPPLAGVGGHATRRLSSGWGLP